MDVPRLRPSLLVAVLALPMVACAPKPPLIPTSSPTSVETTASYDALRNLPAPPKPVPVAVYSYPDLTGQLKTSDTIANNSRAVTQGGVWMLVKSLKDAASGRWFKVIQRANLDNLLKERQIIRETRGKAAKQSGQPQQGLPSLLFAGVILEGGIIGYDSNTVTGGIGARYLGIGGDVQYRQDTVTVYLNAISSQTGEILKSVMTRKTVASYGVRGSVFKFVAFQKLLEGETGYTVNEPGQIAVAQAIEHAVRALVIEGALEGLWQFEDEIAGKDEAQSYLADKEDDLLLGDASSQIAQALLTDEQIEKLGEAREARRERLRAQAERREQRQLAAEREQTLKQKRLAAKTAAPAARLDAPPQPLGQQPKFGQPQAAATKASLTRERLAATVQRRQDALLKRMVSAVAEVDRAKVAPAVANQAKGSTIRSVTLPPVDLSALHTLIAEFNAETKRLSRTENDGDEGKRAWQGRVKPRPAAQPAAVEATPIAATTTSPETRFVEPSKKSRLTWQSGEKL
ncbi:MAG: CsgG/HfaB family protein [Geminicoccaceae bacterium]